MSQVQVAHNGTDHVCYSTETGIDRRYLGCAHRVPRAAIEHADRLMQRDVTEEGSHDRIPATARPALVSPEDAPASRSPEHDPARYHGDGQADPRASEALDPSPGVSVLPPGRQRRPVPVAVHRRRSPGAGVHARTFRSPPALIDRGPRLGNPSTPEETSDRHDGTTVEGPPAPLRRA